MKKKVHVLVKTRPYWINFECPECKWRPRHPEMITSVPKECFQCDTKFDPIIRIMED
jgi:hypothetical protein